MHKWLLAQCAELAVKDLGYELLRFLNEASANEGILGSRLPDVDGSQPGQLRCICLAADFYSQSNFFHFFPIREGFPIPVQANRMMTKNHSPADCQ